MDADKERAVRADENFPDLMRAISGHVAGETLRANAWAREIRKRHGVLASEVYDLAYRQVHKVAPTR